MASLSSADPAPDDVVISGIAGIFPQCKNMDELELKLLNNVSMTEEVEDRFGFREKLGVTCRLGIIQDKDKFDTMFFGISHAQTLRMDSITWRVLEKTYEAVVDSGHNPSELRNTNTAVIVGCFVSESESLWLEHGQAEAGFSIVGHNRSMLANRLSYWLSTKGPSYAVYAEESAGVCGLTQAYQLISSHQCDGAIVVTIDQILRPELSYYYKGLGSQYANGKCSEFDANRNEYSRSNACVAMYIQRASDAKRIYATVAHSDYIYHGSRNSGFVRPMTEPLLQLLQRFYEKCRIDPADISYLEMSSLGIKVFEEAEIEALDKAILSKRRAPLLAGSVKSNMGNTTSSSTLTSIAKVLIAMEKGVIPANLEYRPSVPHIRALTEGKLQIVSENTKWEPKYAAINVMDTFGNYGHIVLRPPSKQKPSDSSCTDGIPRLICISGRDKEKMETILDKISTMPPDMEFVKLLQDIHSANISNHNYRGFVITPSETNAKEVQHFDGSNRPVWFVFSGMGSQWPGMATHLMKLPVIADTLQQCHAILQPKGVDLMAILTRDDPNVFDNILHSFVGIAAIQLALVETLKLLNIQPDGLIGHSVGELGCAYADGCFTMEQMILAAYYRGLASLEAELIEGRMAAVGLGYNKVKSLVPPTVDVACHNSEGSSTISGPSQDITQFVEELKKQGVFAREVNVSNIAYHSRYIKPAAPKLLNYLKQIIPDPKPRSPRWYSTSVPEELWDTDGARYSSAEYHTNNLLNSVLFEEASKHIPKNAILIEIAPHGLLQAILKRSLGADCINIPLTQRGNERGLQFLLSAVGKFYLTGKVPLVSALYPPVQFPVSRRTPSISSLASWDHSKIWRTPENISMKEKRPLNNYIKISLNEGKYHFMKGYRLNGENVLPISAVLALVWKLMGNPRTRNFKNTPVIFENVDAVKTLTFPESESVNLIISLQQGSGNFQITKAGEDTIYFKGRIRPAEDVAREFSPETEPEAEEFEELTADDIYKELENKGYELDEQFRKIRKIVLNEKGSKAVIDWSHKWIIYIDSLLQLSIFHSNEGKQTLQFPKFIQKVVLNPLEPTSQNEYVAVFNKFTRSVRCKGIQVSGIITEELQLQRRINVINRKIQFVPYLKTQHQNSNEFVDAAVQLFLENTGLSGGNSPLIMTELVNSTTINLGPQVKNALSAYQEDKVVMNVVSVDEVHSMSDVALGNVLLATDSTMRQALRLVRNHGGFLLARLEASVKLETDESVAVVAEQCFGNRRWIILKKQVPVNERTTVMYLPQTPFFKFPENLTENGYSRYYLLAETVSLDEVKAFLTYMTSERKHDIKRFIFLMDKDAPPFSLSDQFFTDQLSLDMVINIYYNGAWGSLRHSEVPTGSVAVPNDLNRLKAALRLNNFKWSSVGINWKNPHSGNQDAGGFSVVDVSGYDANGQKVMCVARLESNSVKMTMDPYLTWCVPDSWSLDDSATVPLAYSLAYFSLAVNTCKSRGGSILIQPGQFPVGQAYIAVALERALQVYVAVHGSKHRQYLKNKFPHLQDSNIIDLRDKNYGINLLRMRNYQHFDIVVNFLEEPYLQMSARMLAIPGFLIQLCRTEMEQSKHFGMAPFLNNIALLGTIPEAMFELNEVLKKKLHGAMARGIEDGVVQPFDKAVFSFSQEDEIFRTLRDVEFTGKVIITNNKCHKNKIKNAITLQKENNSGNVFVVDSKKSCLIVGDKPEDCIMLAKWLVHRGCQNLTICCGECTMSNLTRRSLRLLRIHHRAHITVVPLEMTYILQDVMNLLNDVDSTAPLAAVFVLPVKDPQLVYLLEVIVGETESVKHFVLLMSDNTCSIASARRRRRLPVLDVQWDIRQKTVELQHILGNLDELLIRTPSETVYLSIKENSQTNQKLSSGELLLQFLPSSLEDLEALGDELRSCEKCSLVEVGTRTPCMAHVREVHPLYIIPGLQGPANSTAKALARKLTCPAIIVQMPGGIDDLQENVAAIVQELTNLQQGGIYNIAGISCGGVYAIEVAKQLQARGEKTHVFLLDGLPQTNQAIARCLGEGSQLQVNLLSTLLKLDDSKMHRTLAQLPDWNSRLHSVLTELQVPQSYKDNLCIAIESVYSRINTLLNYCPDETMLDGEVTPILPNDSKEVDSKLYKYFNEVNVTLVEGNHRTLLESTEAAFVISSGISVDLYWNRN